MNTKLFLMFSFASAMIGFILAVMVFFSAQYFGVNGIVGSLIICVIVLVPFFIYMAKKLHNDAISGYDNTLKL